MKLQYIGKMQGFEGLGIDTRLWNIIDPGNPYHLSSRTLGGLIELGYVKNLEAVR